MKNVWAKWKSLAESIGDFQFSLIFSFLYFVLVVPFGLLTNFLNNFLDLKGFPKWVKVSRKFETIKDLREQ